MKKNIYKQILSVAVSGCLSVMSLSANISTISGANIDANKLDMNIGGDLTIRSLQDSKKHDSGTLTVGTTKSNLNIEKERYKSVGTQTSINTKQLNIKTQGNTDLIGAKIVSTSPSTLSTGTLTYSDLENQTEYSNIGFGSDGLDSPMAQDKDTQTNTAISNTITVDIKDKTKQTQDISKISNDTQHAHYRVQEVNKELLNIRKDVAGQIAQVGFEYIGDLGTQALKDGDNSWEDGGLKKTMAHTLMGGLVSTIGGNGFKSGAVGAGSREGLSILTENSDKATQSLVSQTIGASANILTGGSTTGALSGANVAYNGEKYNRQLHQDEIKFIKANADKFRNNNPQKRLSGGTITLTQEQAQDLLSKAVLYYNDKDTKNERDSYIIDGYTQEQITQAFEFLQENSKGKIFTDKQNTQELTTQPYFNSTKKQFEDDGYNPNNNLGLIDGSDIFIPIIKGGNNIVKSVFDIGKASTPVIKNGYYSSKNWALQPNNIQNTHDFLDGFSSKYPKFNTKYPFLNPHSIGYGAKKTIEYLSN